MSAEEQIITSCMIRTDVHHLLQAVDRCCQQYQVITVGQCPVTVQAVPQTVATFSQELQQGLSTVPGINNKVPAIQRSVGESGNVPISPLIKSNPFCKNKVQGQTPYFSMWFPLRIICIKQVHLLYNIQNVVVHLTYHNVKCCNAY